jgi:hypothetical protein
VVVGGHQRCRGIGDIRYNGREREEANGEKEMNDTCNQWLWYVISTKPTRRFTFLSGGALPNRP